MTLSNFIIELLLIVFAEQLRLKSLRRVHGRCLWYRLRLMKSQQSIVPTLKWVCHPPTPGLCQRQQHVHTFRKCSWIPTHGWQMTGCLLSHSFWSQLFCGSKCLRLKKGSWRIFLCEAFEFQLCLLLDIWAVAAVGSDLSVYTAETL